MGRGGLLEKMEAVRVWWLSPTSNRLENDKFSDGSIPFCFRHFFCSQILIRRNNTYDNRE